MNASTTDAGSASAQNAVNPAKAATVGFVSLGCPKASINILPNGPPTRS
jgi:ribosomal protein S12 methylthiotransferase